MLPVWSLLITTASPTTGTPLGVQFAAVVQAPPAVWFHVLVAANVDTLDVSIRITIRTGAIHVNELRVLKEVDECFMKILSSFLHLETILPQV